MALNNQGVGFTVSAKDAASSVLKGVSDAFGQTEKAADKAGKAIEQANAKAAREAVKQQKAADAMQRKAQAQAAQEAKTAQRAAEAMQKQATAQAAKEAKAAAQAAKAAEKAQTDAADKVRERAEATGNAMKTTGAVMIGVGVAGLAGLGLAAKEAAKFETAVKKVSTIADAAEFPLSKIEGIGKQMSMTYGGDLTTQLAALYNAIGSGADKAADATALLHESNKLAIGGLTTADSAMQALIGTMNAYNVKDYAANASKFSDAMFQAVKLGGSDMNVEMLSKNLGQVAPIASAAGVSLNELLAGVAQLTSVGVSTSESVTAMKAAITQMLNPTSEATKEAKRLGIQFDAAALRSKGFKKVLSEITSAQGFNADTMNHLFGASVQASLALQTIGSEGGKNYLEFLKEMEGASGASDEAFKKMATTAEFAGQLLESQVKVAMADIGAVVGPLVASLTAFAANVVKAFNELPSPLKRGLVWFAAAGSALLILSGVLLLVAGTIAAVVAAGEALVIGLAVAAGAVVYVAAAFAALALVFAGFKTAYEKNVGGFAAFVESFKKQVDGIGAALGQWVDRVKAFFGGISEGFQSTIATLGPVFAALTSAFSRLTAAFAPVADGPAEAKAKWESFAAVGRTVGSALAKGFGLLVQAGTAVMDVLSGFSAGAGVLGGAVAPLWNSLQLLWASLMRVFDAFQLNVVGGGSAKSVWQSIGEVVGFVVGWIGRGVAFMVDRMAFTISFLSGFVGFMSTLFGGTVNTIKGVFNILKGVLTLDWELMWTGMKQVVFSAVQVIIGIVFSMVQAIASAADTIGKKLGKDLGWSDAVNKTKADLMSGLEKSLGLDVAAAPVAPVPAAGPPPANPVAPGVPDKGAPAPGAGGFTATPAPGAMPALGAAGGAGGAAPVVSMPAQPIDLSTTVQLVMDGDKIAEKVIKQKAATEARSFGPTPTQK